MARSAEEGGRALQQVLVRLPKEEHEALRSFAGLTGISLNEAIIRAVREFLAGEGRREEFDALLARAKSQYEVALDKLKDL
ncbi:MAG TPA: hypothetical protein VII47_16645 [Actinomycetota bacterium]|jgi:hypothetical protein